MTTPTLPFSGIFQAKSKAISISRSISITTLALCVSQLLFAQNHNTKPTPKHNAKSYIQFVPSSVDSTAASKNWRDIFYLWSDPLQTQRKAIKNGLRFPVDAPPELQPALEPASQLKNSAPNHTVLCAQLVKKLPNTRNTNSTKPKKPNATPVLSLAQMSSLLLCQNTQIGSSFVAIKQQAAMLGQARSAWLPQISAGITRQRTKSWLSNNKSNKQTRYQTMQNLGISWRLYDFGVRSNQHKIAKLNLKAAIFEQNATIKNMLTHLVQAYTQAQIAQNNEHTQKQIRNLAQKSLQTARRRLKQGVGSNQEVLHLISMLARSNLEHSKAQGEKNSALANLNALTGLPEGSTYQVQAINNTLYDVKMGSLPANLQHFSPSLKPINLATNPATNSAKKPTQKPTKKAMLAQMHRWKQQAQTNHPALKAAQMQLLSATHQVKATQAQGLPTLDVSFNHYRNGRPNQAATQARWRENVAGITLNIPIFDGFNTTYKVRQAQAQAEQKQVDYTAMQQKITMQTTQAHAQAVASLHTLYAAEGLYLAAYEMALSTQRLFKQGLADTLQLNQAFIGLMQAQAEKSQAQASWIQAKIKLWVLAYSTM